MLTELQRETLFGNTRTLTLLWDRWGHCTQHLFSSLLNYLIFLHFSKHYRSKQLAAGDSYHYFCCRPFPLLSLQQCVRRQSPRVQQKRRSRLRLKWVCWTEDDGSTTYFRKNPSRASTNTFLPSSLICVTGESCILVVGWNTVTVKLEINDVSLYLSVCQGVWGYRSAAAEGDLRQARCGLWTATTVINFMNEDLLLWPNCNMKERKLKTDDRTKICTTLFQNALLSGCHLTAPSVTAGDLGSDISVNFNCDLLVPPTLQLQDQVWCLIFVCNPPEHHWHVFHLLVILDFTYQRLLTYHACSCSIVTRRRTIL